MELVHGGDWAGYRAEFGRDALDFRPTSAHWGCPRAWRRPSQRHCPWRIATRIRSAGHCARRWPRQRVWIPADKFLCGNGAADLIYRLALALRPRRALLPAPTFAEYAAALVTVDCDGTAVCFAGGKRLCRDGRLCGRHRRQHRCSVPLPAQQPHRAGHAARYWCKSCCAAVPTVARCWSWMSASLTFLAARMP